jgi:hypothetical protein
MEVPRHVLTPDANYANIAQTMRVSVVLLQVAVTKFYLYGLVRRTGVVKNNDPRRIMTGVIFLRRIKTP